MSVTEQIKAIDLVRLMEAEGIRLKKHGSRYECLCPFHDDHNPSMSVFADNHARCFACNWAGDAVDFVRERHGFNFKQALDYLGISSGPITKEIRYKIRAAKRQRILKEKRQQRIRDLVFTLGILVRATRKAMASLTPDNFDQLCSIIDPLCQWEYYHQALSFGDDAALEALKDFQTLSRNPTFRPDFDACQWLRETDYAKHPCN